MDGKTTAINEIKKAAENSGVLGKKDKSGLKLQAAVRKWMDDDQAEPSEMVKFLDWCGSDDKAEAVMEHASYQDWLDKFSKQKLVAKSADDVAEALEVLRTQGLNVKMQKEQQALQKAKEWPEKDYVAPGRLLQKMLDANDLDWEFVDANAKSGVKQAMLLADRKNEGAAWEIENNKPAPSEQFVSARKQKQVEAQEEIKEEFLKFAQDEKDRAKEAAKAESLDAIKQAVDLRIQQKVPELNGNALCASMLNAAKTHAGGGGYYEANGEYSAGELRAGWQIWKKLQAEVEKTPIVGFQTWAVGNGTAQDKSDRPDIKNRSHTHQMNFSVTWNGTNQMIHVGLAGTRRK